MNRSAERACQGKKPYTQADAVKVAKRKRAQHIWLNAYSCPHCPHWHVGHLPIADQLRRAASGKDLRPRRRT